MDNPKQQPKNPIGDFDSIEEFTKNGFSLIVNGTKAVNSFPSGASRDSYCAYPAFGKVVDSQSDRILGIISEVLINQNIRGNIQRRQQDEKFELLMDCNDLMLERINSNLDEAAGIRKNPETVLVQTSISTNIQANRNAGSWNYETKKSESPNASPIAASARLITAKNIARPQISFKTPVDNSPNTPFVPRITEKPNSLKPLAVLPEYGEDGQIESYLHPYEFELMKFEPSNDQLKRTDPQKPLPVLKTPLIYVDDEQKLTEMLADLRQSKEIAVDLEHHSYRTFQGFACLMQISTRKTDYIIDALKLREELHVLNEVFTNTKIVKILHGAECDVEWLQRDLSLYLVNMFDTYQAIRLLNFPRLSLAYLLKHYCGIEADKTFQLADWRIRPLPEELIAYARQDTHFLIYIYERLVNDLLDQANGNTNLLKTVFSKSADVCKRRYVKSVVLPDSHLDMHRKSRRIFDNRQLFALKEIFQWRDKIARLEDESYGYVLPNHMMLQIAESLPREMQGILACCNPIPPLVRQNLHALHQIVLKAREQSLVKPIIDEQIVHRATVSFAKDYNSSLHCPHDLSRNPEFRDDLPTLLGQQEQLLISNPPLIDLGEPKVTVFETPDNSEDESWNEKLKSLRREKFISPYDRYKETIPIAEKQRLEEIAKEEAINRAKLLCPIKAEKTVEANVQIKTEKSDDSTDLPIKEMARRKRANQEKKNATSPKEKKAKVESAAENNLTNDSPAGETEMDQANGESPTETDSLIEPDSQTKGENPSPNRQNKKKFKKRKHLPQNKTGQSSNQPVQFDYSKVDFKKFQGGSQKAKGTEIQTNFHAKGKGNKANNKKFNKLFTFGGNVNKKK